MLKPRMRIVAIACCCAAAIVIPAQHSFGQCGCASPAPVTYSASYAPAYVAPYTVGYAPTNTAYMPSVVYRAMYQPTVATAYRPVVGYNTYSGYAVTTYRPLFGWNYPARLVPYTTYRPVYSAAVPVVTYMGCNSCPTYNNCSPCGGSACSDGSCGAVTYGAPASGCSSCAAPATVTPAPYTGNGETAPSLNSIPPKTFQDKVEKPVTEPEAKPIPQTDGKLNSMPTPSLPDPSNRTAARSDYTSTRVQLTSAAIKASPVLDNDGWQPARD